LGKSKSEVFTSIFISSGKWRTEILLSFFIGYEILSKVAYVNLLYVILAITGVNITQAGITKLRGNESEITPSASKILANRFKNPIKIVIELKIRSYLKASR